MGVEATEVLVETGRENQSESLDISGMRISLFSADVHGASVEDPRLSDLCQFLQALVHKLNDENSDMQVFATQESVDELLDILETQVLTKFKLVFAWNGIVAVCEETETLSMLIQLMNYEHADIFGYNLQ